MHSFGLTERWLVLAEFPFVVNPISVPLSGRPYIENYRWKPELGTRITLVDRRTGEATGPFETDPFFCFHHANAYEENGSVVVDACTYADAQIVEDLYLDRLREGKPAARAELRRFRIDSARERSPMSSSPRASSCLGSTTAATTSGPTAMSGASTRSRAGSTGSSRPTSTSGSTTEWAEDGCSPGEPVFVGRPERRAEDEGVLLSVVFDSSSGRSFLLVLDAADLSELARAEAPHRIPYGFHGQFVGD